MSVAGGLPLEMVVSGSSRGRRLLAVRGLENVPARLGRHPGVGPGQRFRPDFPQGKELLEVRKGEQGVELGDRAPWGTHPGVHHREGIPMQTTQESRLGHARVGHGGQIGDQLGIVGRNGRDRDRVGAPDEGPPVGILPQLEVLLRHQLVADDPPGDQPEARLVARVDELFGRCWMKMDHRLRSEDQCPVPALGNRQRPIHRS